MRHWTLIILAVGLMFFATRTDTTATRQYLYYLPVVRIAAMSQSTDAAPPGTCASTTNPGSGDTWDNPNNAKVEDGNFASLAPDASPPIDYLWCTNYGFSIPPASIIRGIEVWVKIVRTGGLGGNVWFSPIKGGTRYSAGAKYVTPTTSLGWIQVSNGIDLFGLSWLPPDLNASDFGMSVESELFGGVLDVDALTVKVYYDRLPSSQSFTVAP